MEQGAEVFDTKAPKTDQDPAAVSEELMKTIGQQTIQIDWLKRVRDLRVVARGAVIEPDEKLTIQKQCRLLARSRSGYHNLPSQESELNLKLLRPSDRRIEPRQSHMGESGDPGRGCGLPQGLRDHARYKGLHR